MAPGANVGAMQRVPDELVDAVVSLAPSARPDQAHPIGSGISTFAFGVPDPTGDWVLRVSVDYPEPWTWRGGRAHEVPLLRALAALGVPVPRDPTAIMPADSRHPVAIIEREVRGEPITSLPADRGALADQLVDFLTALHGIGAQRGAELGVPRASHLDVLTASYRTAKDFLDTATQAWIERTLADLHSSPPPVTVIHSDFRGDHWFCGRDGTLVAVIDFGDVSLDDPAVDLAKFGWQFDPAFTHQVHDRYPDRSGQIQQRARQYEQLGPLLELANVSGHTGEHSDAVAQLRDAALIATTS